MAKNEHVSIKQRVRKSPIESSWFTNVAKSMGFATTDLVKELMPNTANFMEQNASDTMRMVQDMRKNITSRNMVGRQLKQIPQIEMGKRMLRNTLDDIKSGKIYNKDRLNSSDEFDEFNFGDDDDGMFFDDGVEFLDDEDDSNNITINKNNTVRNVIDMMPLANVVAGGAQATVEAIDAVSTENRALATEKMMFDNRLLNTVSGGLESLNQNMGVLVQFHNDSTAKYYAASIKFYDDFMTKFEEKMSGPKMPNIENIPDDNLVDSLYTYKGNVKFDKYKQRIKSNIQAMQEDSLVASQIVDMAKDTTVFNQFVKNPLGTLMGIGLKKIAKPIAGEIVGGLDKSLSAVLPAMMARINSFEDSNNKILNYLYKTFNSKMKYDENVNLGDFYKNEMPWNGIANKTLTEVIPTYLRRIESAITGTPERIYDMNTGKFTTIENVKKNFDKKLREREVNGYKEIANNFSTILSNMGATYELDKQMKEKLDEYLSKMTKKGSVINPFITKDADNMTVDELLDNFDWDETTRTIFRTVMGQMSKHDLSKMASSMIADSRVNANQFMDEIRRDPNKYNYSTLKNNSLYTDDGKLIYDPSKSPLVKGYGGNTEEILSNIMLMLARGIVVYPKYGTGNPNKDMKKAHEKIVNKRKEYKEQYERQISLMEGKNVNGLRNPLDDDTTIKEGSLEWFEDLSEEELSKLAEEAGKEYRSKEYKSNKHNFVSRKVAEKLSNSRLGGIGNIINRTTNAVDNAVYQILFNGKINADTTEEELMEFVRDEIASDENKDKFGGIIGTVKDTFKGILSYFTGRAYRGSNGQVIKTNNGLMDKIRKGIDKVVGKIDDTKGEGDKSILQTISDNFMDGFKQFKIMLFGKKGVTSDDMKESLGDIGRKIKDRLPRSIGRGIAITGVKTAVAANVGLLGSLIMPGGPVAAMITSTTYSFLRQSETFNKWLFGEKDQEGKRMGGFIPKSVQDMVKSHSKQIKIGGAVGAGVGLLPFFFLPGGPITGSLLGAGMGIVSSTDKFQEWLFGEDFKDKDKRSIMNGKFMKLFKDKLPGEGKKIDPKLATFLGGSGALVGLGQGIGLLPSLLLPGGPIMGAMLGLAGGILASTDKFQKWLFGDKEADGRRYGGLLTQFTNWFQTTVVTPFKIQATEIKDNMLYFVEDKIVDPFRKAFAPLTQAFRFVVDDTKAKMGEVWTNLTDKIVTSFNDKVIKPFGEKLEKYVVDPLKKLFSKALSMVGKVLGTMVSLPIKLATGILGGTANMFNKRHVRKSEMKKNREEYGYVRGTFKTWKNRKQAYKDNIFYMSDEYKQKEEERKQNRQEERDKRRQQIEDMRRQYEEDREYGKQSNWKWASKKQREKHEEDVKKRQQWMAEQSAIKTQEIAQQTEIISNNISSIDSIIERIPKFDTDRRDQLEDIKKALLQKLDLLIQQGNSSDTRFNDISMDRLSSKDRTKAVYSTLSKHKNTESEKWIKDYYKKKLEELRSKNSHAEGLDEVPEDDYLANLHEGEMVVPKEGADDLREIGEDLEDLEDADSKTKKTSKKKNKKHSIVDRLFGSKDGKKQGFLGKMMAKFKKEDERDRSDNRYGKTELEEKRDKAELDDQRRAYVSRKNVDWLQAKWQQEKQHEEDMKYQAAILKALQKSNKDEKKKTSWMEKLFGKNGLIGSFFNGGWISGILKVAGMLGIGALISKLLGGDNSLTEFINYMNGDDHENRETPDGDYVSAGTTAQAVKSGAKVVAKDFIKNGERRGRNAIRATNALKRGAKAVHNSKAGKMVRSGAKSVGNLAKSGFSKLGNTTTGKAIKSGASAVKDMGKNAFSAGSTWFKNTAKSALKKGSSEGAKSAAKSAVKEGAENSAKTAAKSKTLAGKFCDKLLSAGKSLAREVEKKLAKEGGEKGAKIVLTDVFEKIVKKIIEAAPQVIKKFGTKICAEIGEDAAKSIPVVGWIAQGVMTIYDVTTGWTKGNTANLFQVPENMVDSKMKLVSSVLQGITNFSWLGLIWLANDISKVMWDVSFLREIAIKIYDCIGGDANNFSSKMENASTTMGYKQAVEAAGADWSKFKGRDPREIDMTSMGISAEDQEIITINYVNETEGTKYSRSAYADQYNPLFGAKVWRGVKSFGKNVKKFFTGDKKDNKNENTTKTTGSKDTQKTETTASKNESDNTKYAGLGGDPAEYETQINPDSKVNYEKTSEGSGNSIFNTLKTFIPPKLAKTMVQSDTAEKPALNEEDLKLQGENSKINFKNAIETLFGTLTGTRIAPLTIGGKTAENLIKINEDSTDNMANDMTKSQLLVSKSFSKQQKILSDTYKASSKKMDKSTRNISKELDKQIKKFETATKKTFTMFNSKMGSMLKIMNGANINASSGSVSSNPISNAITAVGDAINDALTDNDEKVKDATENNESASTVSGNGTTDGLGEIRKDNSNAGGSGMTEQDKNFLRKLNYEKYSPSQSDYITTPQQTNNTTNNINKSSTKMVFYSQGDSRWGSTMIGDKTMKDAGCGPTSIAMAISQLTGQMVTPEAIATLGRDQLPGYSTYSLFPTIADKLNMNYEETTSNYGSFIKSKLKKGIPVVISGRSTSSNSPYTREGHIITVSRMDGNKVFVQDPKGKEFSKYYRLQDILPRITKTMSYGLTKQMNIGDLPSSGTMEDIDNSIYKKMNMNDLGIYNVAMMKNNNAGLDGATNTGNASVEWGYFCDPELGGITSYFGEKRNKYANANGNHGALDYNVHYQPVYAPKSGTVVSENEHYSYGNSLCIQTGDSNTYYRIAHMKSKNVKKGDSVKMGQNIGVSGATGEVSGPHIHFEVLKGGTSKAKNGVDPLNYYDTYTSGGKTRVKIKGGMSFNDYINNVGSIAEAGSSDGTTSSEGAPAPTESVELMGVFSKMNKTAQNYIASIMNGKEVDLFGTTATADNTASSSSTTGSGNFPKYELTDDQIKGLAHVVEGEQPGIEGQYAEASIMANLTDITGDDKATTENLIKKVTGGWFANGAYRFAHPGNPSSTAIQAVKDVIVGGKRTLPRYIDEHDCFSDITSATNEGKSIDKSDRSAYKQFVTKIKNRYGASGTFYTFPNSKSDPFYYTSEENRKKWGDDHYSAASQGAGFGDNGKSYINATDNLNYYNQYFLNRDEEPDELGLSNILIDEKEGPEKFRKDKDDTIDPSLAGGEDTSTSSSSKYPSSKNGYAYFSQVDPRWNTSNIAGASVKMSGCGPTSHAMMLTTMFGKVINPATMAQWGSKKGVWSGSGMSWSMPPLVASEFGLKINKSIDGKSTSALNEVKSELKSGHPVVMSGRASDRGTDTPFTPSGHIVLAVGVDGNGNIVINDPRSADRSKGYTDAGMQKGTGLRHSWSFVKTDSSSIPSDVATGEAFSADSSIATEGSTSGTSSVELMGVFSNLNKTAQNYIASIMNGKEVDLFGTPAAADNTASSSGAIGTFTEEEWNNAMFMGDSIAVPFSSAGGIPADRVAAVGGDTAQKGLKQVSKVVAKKPPMVIANYGTNDSAYFCDTESNKKHRNKWFKENYIKLIKQVKEGSPNTKFVLNQVFESTRDPWTQTIPEIQPIVSEIASETGSTLVDVREINKQGTDYHVSDGVHFKSSFYPVWLNALKSKLVGGGAGFGETGMELPYMSDEYDTEGLFEDEESEYAGLAEDSPSSSTSTSSSIPATLNNFAYFSQADPRWNTERINGTDILHAGCGPTSHSMLLTNMFGKIINPVTMTKWALSNGVWNSNGMLWTMPPKVASTFGLNIPYSSDAGKSDSVLSKIKEEIKAGRPVIMSGTSPAGDSAGNYPFTDSGHIIIGVGVDGSGNILVNDPRGVTRTKAYSDDSFKKGVGLRGCWSFEKTDNMKIPDGITVDGDYTASGSSSGTSTQQQESVGLLGVFDKMSKVVQNYVASIFNGKEVDLFAAPVLDSSSTTSGTNGTDVSGANVAEQIYNYSRGKGCSQAAAAGIVGNAERESNFDPSAEGPANQHSIGLFQWLMPEDQQKIYALAKQEGKEWSDVGVQLKYLWDDIGDPNSWHSKNFDSSIGTKGQLGSGMAAFKALTSPEKAASIFENCFERSAETTNKREQFARKWYDKFTAEGKGPAEPIGKGGGDGNTYLINPASSGSKSSAIKIPNTNTNYAGKGGDGKYYTATPSVDKYAKPEPTPKLSKRGFIHAGLGEGLQKLKELSKNSDYTIDNNRPIQQNNTIVQNTKDTKLTGAMVDSLIEILTEIKEINKNTAITAENTSKIEVYSKNEPVSKYTNTARKTNISNNRVGSTNDSSYKTARDIASFITI